MVRIATPRLMVLALAALGCAASGGAPCPPGPGLTVPACAKQVTGVATSGPCSATGPTAGTVWVKPSGEGRCAISMTLADSRIVTAALEFKRASVACGEYQSTWVERPDFACPDAGPCAGQTGCFLVPEQGDCSLRCAVTDSRGCAVAAAGMGAVGAACKDVCVCGPVASYSMVDGCTKDDECVLADADGCGCSSGGSGVAVLRTHLDKWASNQPHGRDGGCPAVLACQSVKAVCEQARCVAR